MNIDKVKEENVHGGSSMTTTSSPAWYFSQIKELRDSLHKQEELHNKAVETLSRQHEVALGAAKAVWAKKEENYENQIKTLSTKIEEMKRNLRYTTETLLSDNKNDKNSVLTVDSLVQNIEAVLRSPRVPAMNTGTQQNKIVDTMIPILSVNTSLNENEVPVKSSSNESLHTDVTTINQETYTTEDLLNSSIPIASENLISDNSFFVESRSLQNIEQSSSDTLTKTIISSNSQHKEFDNESLLQQSHEELLLRRVDLATSQYPTCKVTTGKLPFPRLASPRLIPSRKHPFSPESLSVTVTTIKSTRSDSSPLNSSRSSFLTHLSPRPASARAALENDTISATRTESIAPLNTITSPSVDKRKAPIIPRLALQDIHLKHKSIDAKTHVTVISEDKKKIDLTRPQKTKRASVFSYSPLPSIISFGQTELEHATPSHQQSINGSTDDWVSSLWDMVGWVSHRGEPEKFKDDTKGTAKLISKLNKSLSESQKIINLYIHGSVCFKCRICGFNLLVEEFPDHINCCIDHYMNITHTFISHRGLTASTTNKEFNSHQNHQFNLLQKEITTVDRFMVLTQRRVSEPIESQNDEEHKIYITTIEYTPVEEHPPEIIRIKKHLSDFISFHHILKTQIPSTVFSDAQWTPGQDVASTTFCKLQVEQGPLNLFIIEEQLLDRYTKLIFRIRTTRMSPNVKTFFNIPSHWNI